MVKRNDLLTRREGGAAVPGPVTTDYNHGPYA